MVLIFLYVFFILFFRLLLVIHHFTERVAPGCLLLSFFFLVMHGVCRWCFCFQPDLSLISSSERQAWWVVRIYVTPWITVYDRKELDIFFLLYFTSHSPFFIYFSFSLFNFSSYIGSSSVGIPTSYLIWLFIIYFTYYLLPTYFILLLLLIVLKDLLLFLSFLLLVNFPIADQEVVNEFDI